MLKPIIKKIIDLLPEKIVELCFKYRFSDAIISYSQNGEDILLAHHLFQNKNDGFYIDVGAHHPQRFSNTYLLYKKGWSGINIDPIPGMEIHFKERNRDININAGVSDKRGKIKYYTFAKGTFNTCDEEIAKIQSKVFGEITVKEIEVYTLKEIVDTNSLNRKLDFMSIDVEGFELKILNSHDWIKYPPTVIAIEDQNIDLNNPEKSSTYSFLKTKGYSLIDKINYTSFYKK